jgi:hypothetical protein
MTTVYVVVQDRACEYGPPQAVFSTQDLAKACVDKLRERQLEIDGIYTSGFFILPYTIDSASEPSEKALLIGRDGKIEVL